MGIWENVVTTIFGLPEDEEGARGSIRERVREVRNTRQRADAAIDELAEQAEQAIRSSGRTPASAVQDARRELGRSVGNGGR